LVECEKEVTCFYDAKMTIAKNHSNVEIFSLHTSLSLQLNQY
jgi:hypothetical protein